jgi:hypothetical protein
MVFMILHTRISAGRNNSGLALVHGGEEDISPKERRRHDLHSFRVGGNALTDQADLQAALREWGHAIRDRMLKLVREAMRNSEKIEANRKDRGKKRGD